MDIRVANRYVLEVGGFEIWITESLINTWIIIAAVILFAVSARIYMKKFTELPAGFQNVLESMVEIFDNFVVSSAGEGFVSLGNWFFTIFIMMFLSNISGIFGMRAPTADWSVALGYALGTFFAIHIMGIRRRKGNYLKSFLKPVFLFLPLNIISELSRPISLSLRLFGNVLVGFIVMTLVHALLPIAARLILPAALQIYFDIISGALQTYIFCMLSLTIIGNAATEDAE